MRLLARFFGLPGREQATLVEAMACLGFARLLLLLPFRRLAPLLGRPQAAGGGALEIEEAGDRVAAFGIRRAITRMARHLPWHSTCLVCAIAGRMMLWRRRMPSILLLGAVKDSETALAAHAWLRSGDIDVVGIDGSDRFTPVAVFIA